jgi:mitochondrial enoyl-[acyl-carrier protein] reductase / trans-2-enoyl-CoA reductase
VTRDVRPMLRLTAHRRFSTSSALLANRAIVYHSNGDPRSILSALTFPSLPPPPPNTLNVKYLLAPVNPADINVIEGVYPSKPSPTKLNNDNVLVAGNEGLAEVTGVGSEVSGFENGQWVVMGKQQYGTWRSGANVNVEDVIKVPRGASEVGAATITVNDSFVVCIKICPQMSHRSIRRRRIICSLNLWLSSKVTGSCRMAPIVLYVLSYLIPGNLSHANMQVGQAVIQIAASRGLKTINFIRNRSVHFVTPLPNDPNTYFTS